MDWASISWVFTSRHSPSTSTNLTSPLIFYKGKAKRLGTSSAAFGLEIRAPRHIITSTRAIYEHNSAIILSELPLPEKKHQKTQEKIEKMSDDEAKGLRSELGTLAVFLALNLSNKKQSPKKQYRKSGYI